MTGRQTKKEVDGGTDELDRQTETETGAETVDDLDRQADKDRWRDKMET